MVKKINTLNKELVVKSNYIIEASYKLNLQEQRLIYMLTSKINKDDIEFKPTRFNLKEINNLLIKHKLTFNELQQHINSLRDKELTIIKEESILQTKWLSSAEYFNDGNIELCFDNKLKPYLLQLKERFTKMNLNKAITFTSNYSCRMYELLKQYENVKERIISIENLRKMFCIGPEEYKLYGDFKRKVILQAQKEINSNSDISFDFQEIKTKRKVSDIRFLITVKDCDIQTYELVKIEDVNLIEKAKKIFYKHDFSVKEIKLLLKYSKNNLNKLKECYEYSLTQNVKNMIPYLKTLLKDYSKPKGNVAQSNFNNFEQRNYDFDKLEAGLLGYEELSMDEVLIK